jgi:hypothetical protein
MYNWVAAELESLDLGDKRRERRVVQMVEKMAQCRGASIVATFDRTAEVRAAYRALASPDFDPAAVRAAQRAAGLGRARQAPVVLAIQDTTQFAFAKSPAAAATKQGWRVHTILLAEASGVPLGVLDQQVWSQPADQEPQAPQRRRRPADEKESDRWRQGLVLTQQVIPADQTVITVADREADLFALFAAPRPDHSHLLIRAAYDRCVTQEQGHLWATVEAAPVAVELTLVLRRRPDRPARRARLQVRYCPVTLQPPAQGARATRPAPVPVTAVLVRELDPPTGTAPVEGLLLTTLPTPDAKAAAEWLRLYTQRWLIERYHYTLKSGCGLEDSQLRSAAGLENLLSLYSLVAWRLLWMTYAARAHSEEPCTVAFLEIEWQTLWRLRQLGQPLPDQPPTLQQAVRMLGGLGGHLGRKGDAEPGVKVLWRGLTRLQDIVIGVQLVSPSLDVGNA